MFQLRVTEEGPETTRERHSKIRNHKKQHHSGIVFPKKDLNSSQGHDSEAEDIQQQIAEIDKAESEYHSDRLKFGSNQQTESEKNLNVRYLDLSTKNFGAETNKPSKPEKYPKLAPENSGVKDSYDIF